MAKSKVKSIGKYRILRRISSGDLAEIFKVRLEGIGGFRRLFAIKRIQPHLAGNLRYAELIEEEARIAALLSHGNIVQVLDIGREDGHLYLVMEHVDGWDLGAILATCHALDRTVPAPHAVWLALQVLKALEYAHQRTIENEEGGRDIGLIHGEVSPANILVSRQGEVKLTDFGFASANRKASNHNGALLLDSEEYRSPEHARGEPLLPQSDLFQVGLVLLECLTLVQPFRSKGGEASGEILREGLCGPLPIALEGDLKTLLSEVLRGDPSARPQTATEMKTRLEDYLRDQDEVFTHDMMARWLQGLMADYVDPVAAEEAAPPPEPDMHAPILPDLPEEPDRTLPAERAAQAFRQGVAKQTPRANAAQRGPSTDTRPHPTRRKVRVSTLTTLAATVMIGVFLGVLTLMVFQKATGRHTLEPQLDVRLADGLDGEVQVDGQPVDPATALTTTPGLHDVRITSAEGTSLEIEVQLRSGEYRVLFIEPQIIRVPEPEPIVAFERTAVPETTDEVMETVTGLQQAVEPTEEPP